MSKSKSRLRNLDQEELGPGYDEDRQNQEADDVDGYENEVIQERAQTILDVGIGRHAIPKPSDGEVRSYECTFKYVAHQRLLVALSSPVSQLLRD